MVSVRLTVPSTVPEARVREAIGVPGRRGRRLKRAPVHVYRKRASRSRGAPSAFQELILTRIVNLSVVQVGALGRCWPCCGARQDRRASANSALLGRVGLGGREVGAQAARYSAAPRTNVARRRRAGRGYMGVAPSWRTDRVSGLVEWRHTTRPICLPIASRRTRGAVAGARSGAGPGYGTGSMGVRLERSGRVDRRA
jgi:hypothetical protein